MGPRNDDELTPAQEAHADQVVRALLTRHDEPTYLAPPSLLAIHIAAQLPQLPPAQIEAVSQRIRRRRTVATLGVGLLVVLLAALGVWGTFVNSSGPAVLFGGVDTTLGHIALVLTLIAKPLLKLITVLSVPTLAASVLLVACAAWAWRQLAQDTPVPAFAEVEL